MQFPDISLCLSAVATRKSAVLTACLALALSMNASKAMAQDEAPRFDWMPPESVSDSTKAAESGDVIIPEIIVIKTPMATADKSRFMTKKYELELAKFGIKNNGTDPAATAKGINEALQYAKSISATYITFPKGTYLLDSVNHPIALDLQDCIIDLNGSTLIGKTDGNIDVNTIEINHGASNMRLTNGILRGDKSQNQGGTGLNFNGGVNIEVDHLKVYNFTMDGFSSSTVGARDRAGLLARIIENVTIKNLEPGALNEQGKKVDNELKTRTAKPYDMTKANGEFEVGYTVGYQGYPQAKGRVYQAYFYDRDMQFITMEKLLQFHKVKLPKDTMYMHLEFNEPGIQGDAQGLVVRITNFTPSVKVHMHDNLLEGNKRLGMAICGGQEWIIENNDFVGNGGAPPAYGIDFEDGWELVQHVVFRNNRFKGNLAGDFVAVSGTELIIEGNQFEKSVVVYGRVHNYFYRNNNSKGNVFFTTRTGVAEFSGNTYENGNLSIFFDTKAVADGIYRKPGETVPTPPLLFKNETLLNLKKVSGTYLNFENARVSNVTFEVGKDTKLVRFINSIARGATIEYVADGPQFLYEIKGNKGSWSETGNGKGRGKQLPR